jgi:hypothetical protein
VTRLYAYAGVLLAVLLIGFGAGWQIQGWRAGAARASAVESARAAEKAAQQGVIDSLKSDIKAATESSNGYQAELTRLRNAARPVSVRVCESARSAPADLPRTADTSSGSSPTTEAGRVLPEQAGNDIGPDLAALADEADRCSAQLRGLIDWVRRINPSKPRLPPP